jgi:O-antigen ligase
MRASLDLPATRDHTGTAALPFVVWIVLVSTGVAVVTSGVQVLGVRLLAFTWMVPLVVALLDLAFVRGKPHLPLRIWMPWLLLLLVYVLRADTENALQRTVMMATPLIVGLAVSKHVSSPTCLQRFERANVLLTVAFLAGVVVKSGLSLRGLPSPSALAPNVMTGALLASLFASRYALGTQRSLVWWGVLAFAPVVALTRTGIVVTALTLPLTLAPLAWKRRAAFAGLLLAAALAVFQTERVQRKMFSSGEGTLADLTLDNPDIRWSGRRQIWEYLEAQIDKRPWFGHGANASEPVALALSHGASHPHNDWLRLRYEYGNFGAAVFAACMLAQLLHLWRGARRADPHRKVLAYAGASSFIAFSVFMLTDNIILYTSFFGNLQFTIIGLAYSGEPPSPESGATSVLGTTSA